MSFTKPAILQALRHLDEELASRGHETRVIIAGGAAMVARHGGRTHTSDIDVFTSDTQGLPSAVRSVARAHDLPNGWMNSAATAYAPPSLERVEKLFTGSHLTADVLPFDTLLAMKLRSLRDKDVRDARALMARHGLKKPEECRQLLRHHFPNRPDCHDLSPRIARFLARELRGHPAR